MKTKKVGDAIDDPEFSDSDDELNIKPDQHISKTDTQCNSTTKISVAQKCELSNDFIEDDIEYFEQESSDNEIDEKDEDELNVMDELAEAIPKFDRSFQSGHPQCRTHQARMKRENPLVVPNFTPNTLPRSDRGDREYYCCTMLTFFKPWRSGKDLKGDMETWDKSFSQCEFSKRQLDIMKFFNVRYECLDARDDYSAKRDKSDDENIKYQWATENLLDALDDVHYTETYSGADFAVNTNEEHDSYNIFGKKGKYRQDAMSLAERTMNMSGWLDPSIDGLPDVGPLTPMKPEIEQSGKLWRCYELQITCGEWAIASHGKLLIPLVFFVHIDESAITFFKLFFKEL